MVDIFDKSNPIDVEFRIPQLEDAFMCKFDTVQEHETLEGLVLFFVNHLTKCRPLTYTVEEFGDTGNVFTIKHKKGVLAGSTAFVIFLRFYDAVSGKEVV